MAYLKELFFKRLFVVLVIYLSLSACDFNGLPENNPDPDPGPPVDALELFEALRGRPVNTGGWADFANNGEGIAYASPANLTLISPETHPDPIARRQAFTAALNNNNPTFIIVSGDIDLSDGSITNAPGHFPGVTDTNVNHRRFDIGSNTTIIGINNARIMFGGLQIINRHNIIIRNLTFWDARDTRSDPGLDGLLINNGSTGVWLDHLKFSSGEAPFNAPGAGDWHDTLLNVRNGAVTVSWSEFTNGNEVLLVGSNDNEINPEQRRVTLHHNYFHGARTRMPRTRGTQMHIYNNFFRNIGAPGGTFGGGYVMGPGINAHFVVQNNLFEASIHQNRVIHWNFNNHGAVVWHSGNEGLPLNPASLTGGGSPAPVLTTDVALRPWNPADFYDYVLNAHGNVQALRSVIPARAGPTLWALEDFLTNLRD